jgi:hypothetical protein
VVDYGPYRIEKSALAANLRGYADDSSGRTFTITLFERTTQDYHLVLERPGLARKTRIMITDGSSKDVARIIGECFGGEKRALPPDVEAMVQRTLRWARDSVVLRIVSGRVESSSTIPSQLNP